MADMHNQHHASGTAMMQGGTGHRAMMGRERGEMMMMVPPPSRAAVEDTEGGARISLTPDDPAQASELRSALRLHASKGRGCQASACVWTSKSTMPALTAKPRREPSLQATGEGPGGGSPSKRAQPSMAERGLTASPHVQYMKRVLIIEDDTSIRECIAEVLDMEGYWVSQAGDGREGLRVARERPPNLILLDLMMPIMNGWQFRDAQKEDAALADIPVIVISAVAKEPWSRLEGAAALFPKPFDTAGLLAAVARHATTEAVADRVICRGPAGLRGGVHSPSRPVSARTHTALRGLADGGERGEEPGMKREPPSGLIARTRRWS